MPRSRSLVRAASRCTSQKSRAFWINSVTFSTIWSTNSYREYNKIFRGTHTDLVLNAPTLNYPVHKTFSSADNFNAELVLNEIDRVVNSNEAFDIINIIKVSVLSLSLPAMGGKRIGGIQSRTVPDIKLLMKQKKSVIVIKSFTNDCLIKVLAIGKKVCQRGIVEPLTKNSGKNLHLDRAQMRERQNFRKLEEEPSFDQAYLSTLGSSKQVHLSGNCSEVTLTSSTDLFINEQTMFSKPFFLDDLHYLSSTNILNKFCISV